MFRSARLSTLRRSIAVASISVSLFALGIGPAAAVDDLVSIRKNFELIGDRDRLHADLKVLDSARRSGLEVFFGLGASEASDDLSATGSVTVRLGQVTGDKESRYVETFAYGYYTDAPEGHTCQVDGSYYVGCWRDGFDWEKGHSYRIVIDRGNHTNDGWLWTVSIIDQDTNKESVLLSVRMAFAQLSTQRQFVKLELHPNDCEHVDSYAANVQKPAGPDTTVTWGDRLTTNECTGVTTSTTIDSGVLKLRIARSAVE